MEIWRIKNDVENSIIFYKDQTVVIKDLPPGLKKMLIAALRKITEAKKIIPTFQNNGKIAGVIIELPEKFVYLAGLQGLSADAKNKCATALELLLWHLSPHWRSKDPNTLGSTKYCIDCGSRWHNGETECMEMACPSFGKMRLIAGNP